VNASLQAVSEREKGAFAISIGTSLALEGAFGQYPDRPEFPAPIASGVKEMWINVRTLLRNLLGSLPTEVKNSALPDVLHIALLEEFQIIEATLAKGSEGMVYPVYYLPDYSTLQQKFPHALVKQPHTALQKTMHALEYQTMRLVASNPGQHEVRKYGIQITGSHPETFILTHYPVDLLARSAFRSLKLLESHTGHVKPPSQWYTKLTNGRELPNMPFGQFSLQVFGDNSTQFTGMPSVIREEVLRVAKVNQWNVLTTKDRITLCLKAIKDPMTRTFLLSLV
jgi:hypothetical protein